MTILDGVLNIKINLKDLCNLMGVYGSKNDLSNLINDSSSSGIVNEVGSVGESASPKDELGTSNVTKEKNESFMVRCSDKCVSRVDNLGQRPVKVDEVVFPSLPLLIESKKKKPQGCQCFM